MAPCPTYIFADPLTLVFALATIFTWHLALELDCPAACCSDYRILVPARPLQPTVHPSFAHSLQRLAGVLLAVPFFAVALPACIHWLDRDGPVPTESDIRDHARNTLIPQLSIATTMQVLCALGWFDEVTWAERIIVSSFSSGRGALGVRSRVC